MKSSLNKKLVESLNESTKEEFSKAINDKVYTLVGSAIEDIAEKSPFVKPEKCIIIPVNEVCTGAISQQSEYTYFLGIDNPQIAANTKTRKNWWKFAWSEFKASWRIGRKKYKKKKKGAEQKKTIEFEKYQLTDFKSDVMMNMANYLNESTKLYELPYNISIIGSEDFGTGIKINIYVCYFDSETATFKLYKTSRNKFVDFNFGARYENLEKKTNWCGPMFVNMLKLINILYAKKYNKAANQIVAESVLYACPNNLFDGKDLYKSFVNIANYIRFKDPKTIVSICDEKTPFLKDKLVSMANAAVDYGRIVNMLDEYKF